MLKDPQIAAVRADVVAARDALAAEVQRARAGARVDGDHRPANRGERGAVSAEGGLAGALAVRLAEAEEALRQIDALAPGARAAAGPGAWVQVEGDDGERTWRIVPGATGQLVGDGVIAVSPASPVGRALHGARVGEERVVVMGGEERVWTVTAVR